jgi:hypothetical protein
VGRRALEIRETKMSYAEKHRPQLDDISHILVVVLAGIVVNVP